MLSGKKVSLSGNQQKFPKFFLQKTFSRSRWDRNGRKSARMFGIFILQEFPEPGKISCIRQFPRPGDQNIPSKLNSTAQIFKKRGKKMFYLLIVVAVLVIFNLLKILGIFFREKEDRLIDRSNKF